MIRTVHVDPVAEEVARVTAALNEALQNGYFHRPWSAADDVEAARRMLLDALMATRPDVDWSAHLLFVPGQRRDDVNAGNFLTAMLMLCVQYGWPLPLPDDEMIRANAYRAPSGQVFSWRNGGLDVVLPLPANHIHFTINITDETTNESTERETGEGATPPANR